MNKVIELLPEDIALKIAHDVRDLTWRNIMSEMMGKLFCVDLCLDRGYTIRNYMEEWAVIPRYIYNNRVYGSYLRRGVLIRDAL
jgi:hypothetical protein